MGGGGEGGNLEFWDAKAPLPPLPSLCMKYGIHYEVLEAINVYTNSPINVVVRFLKTTSLTETTLSETDFTIDTYINRGYAPSVHFLPKYSHTVTD